MTDREPPADRLFHSTHAMLSARSMLWHAMLQQRCATTPDAGLAIEEDALALLHQVLRDDAEDQRREPRRGGRTRRQRQDLIAATRMALLAAPGRSRSLTELAHAVGSSPFHLTRVFRRELGVPVHQYLLRLRLALALERIRQGAEPLSRLAFDLGFSSHSHFTAAFRRAYGTTPSAVARGTVSALLDGETALPLLRAGPIHS